VGVRVDHECSKLPIRLAASFWSLGKAWA
jgi:hypothetical protein